MEEQDLVFNFSFNDKGLSKTIKDITTKCNRLYAATQRGNAESAKSFNRVGAEIEKNSSKIDGLEKKYNELIKEQQELENAKIPTDSYTEALNKADELEEKWRELNKKINDFDATGNTNENLDNLKEQADEISKYIEQAQAKLSSNLGRMSPASIQQAIKVIDEYKTKLKEVQTQITELETPKAKAQREKFNGMRKELINLEDELDEVNFKIIKMEDEDKAFVTGSTTPKYAKLTEDIKNVETNLNQAKMKQDDLVQKQAKIGESILKSSNKWNDFKKAVSGVKANVSKLGSHIKASLGKAFSSAKLAANKFFNSTKRQTRDVISHILRLTLGIGGVALALNAIRNGAKTGFSNLAKYSSSTANQIQGLKNSLLQLKNALATAFQPVLAVVAPILQKLIGYCISAANAVASFFAAFTGQKTVYKATAINQSYADSLKDTGKAAKEANKQLGEYDNLMVISAEDTANAGSGGGGGINPSDMFETTEVDESVKSFVDKIKEAWKDADFTELGKELADKITGVLNGINWEEIKATTNKFSKSLATFLNGLIDPKLMEAIGTTVAEALNTGFGAIETFADNFDWEGNGRDIAQGINSFVSAFDADTAANAIGKLLTGFKDFAKGVLEEIDWTEISNKLTTFASKLGTFVNDILTDKDLWKDVGTTIAGALNTLVSAINGFVTNINWKEVGDSVASGFNTLVKKFDAKNLAEAISNMVIAVEDFFIGAVKGVDWDEVGQKVVDLFTGIKWGEIFGKAAKLLTELVKGIGKVFGKIATDPEMISLLSSAAVAIMGVFGAKMCLESTIKPALKGIGNAVMTIITTDISAIAASESAAAIGATIAAGIFAGIVAAIGGWKLGNMIYEGLEKDENGDNIIDRFVTKVCDTIKNAFETGKKLLEIGKDIVKGLFEGISLKDALSKSPLQWFKENLVDPIIDAVKDLLGIHSPSTVFKEIGGFIIDGLKEGITNAVANIKEWFDKNVISKITDAWDNIKEFTMTVKGKVDETFTKLKEGWDSIKEETVKKISEGVIGQTFDNLKTAWEEVKTKGITATGKGIIESTLTELRKIWGYIKTKTRKITGEGVVTKALETLKGIWEAIKTKRPKLTLLRAGESNSALDTIKNKWNAIKSKTATLTLKFVATVERIKSWINSNVISKINAAFDKTKILSGINIPPLAKGAVIPPNKEFLALLGDQKHGTNIETPLSTMKQAFLEALDEGGYTKKEESGSTDNKPIVLQVDGKEMARVVWDEQEKRYKQLGKYTPIFS